jgi:hypothetical protein
MEEKPLACTAFRYAGHRHQLQRNTSSRDASHRFLESMSEADL